jgi:hypothetical protein
MSKVNEEDFRVRFDRAVKKLGKKNVVYDWDKLRDEVELAYTGRVSGKTYEGGYWEGGGVYQNLKNFLWENYVPNEDGEVDNYKINILIDVNMIAHDLYNNGWSNKRGFCYSEIILAPPIIQKIARNIDSYEILHDRQESAKVELEDVQSNLNDAMEQLAELCNVDYQPFELEEEHGVYAVPFSYLDIEYAMNAAIRLCIGASYLDDSKVYPNIELYKL